MQYFFTDYEASNITLIQFYVMQAVLEMYPDRNPFEHVGLFDKVYGTDYIRKVFGKRYLVDDIIEYWNKDVEDFREMSKKYYLYRQ